MDPWLIGTIALIVGGGLGAATTALVFTVRRGRVQTELANAQARTSFLDEQIREQQAELQRVRGELNTAQQQRGEAEQRIAALNEQLKAREQQFVEQQELLREAKTQLSDAFSSLGSKALAANNEQFLALAKKTFEGLMSEAKGDVEKKQQAIDAMVKPIRDLLEKHSVAVKELETKREVAYKGLEEQIRHIIAANEKLDRETGRLVSALRRPEQRGRWGEMQLRNVVELAGMTEHCDFDEQPATDDPTTRDRPDMTVHMPGGGRIVVDAKVALDAYLDALQPDADRETLMRRHGDQVQSHYKRLAAKQYWEQFDRTPKLVVMFMPLESALVAALESKPTLHADAMQNHVLIATPTLLVALLRAVAYGWQQEAVAENARDIARVGGELHERIAVFVRHFERVGSNLEKATRSYNDAVGSMESRVLPSTRKLEQLRANTGEEIDSPAPLEIEARPFTAAELRTLSTGEET